VIPLRDTIPSRTAPVVTVALIAVNVIVFLHEASLGPYLDRFVFAYGLVPRRLNRDWYGLVGASPVAARLATLGCEVLMMWGLARFVAPLTIGPAGIALLLLAILVAAMLFSHAAVVGVLSGPSSAGSRMLLTAAAMVKVSGGVPKAETTIMNDREMTDVLREAKTIAVVGLSNNPMRPSFGVSRFLQRQGYRVIPVNPNETEVLGEKAYPSLEAIAGKVDIVDVFRRAEATPPIADQAVKIGATTLWLQHGIASEDAAARASAGGLSVVMDLCIGTMHSLLQVPKRKS